MKQAIVGLAGLCIILFVFLYILAKLFRQLEEKNKELERLTAKQRQNIEVLQNYAGDVEKIKDEKQETVQKIERAESDADALAVAVDIIRSNNERVQDGKRAE